MADTVGLNPAVVGQSGHAAMLLTSFDRQHEFRKYFAPVWLAFEFANAFEVTIGLGAKQRVEFCDGAVSTMRTSDDREDFYGPRASHNPTWRVRWAGLPPAGGIRWTDADVAKFQACSYTAMPTLSAAKY